MKKLENRVAVITGGSRGIGKGIAVEFAKQGANIAISYRRNSAAAAETVAKCEKYGVKAIAVQANVGNSADVRRMADTVEKEFGFVDILVNNAGTIGLEVTIEEMEEAEWDRVVNTDLKGVFLNCKYFIPLIKARTDGTVGKIINISSELSKKGRECYGHYAASKGGINSLTMCLALELAPEINVNIVAPGPVETDMILADMEAEWVEKEKNIPLRRLGTVEEIAAAALLLASDDGNFFCGQFVSPNGGAVFF